MSTSVKKVPQSKLGVSEPPPEWFGNPPNVCKDSWSNSNWLKSRFHFSFAEYNNPGNQNFGVLRVMNDDLVQPDRGFGAHPHRDVEICTYIVNGHLTHKDSMGTAETLTRGAVQFMTAGSGVTHSEHNLNTESPLRFIQIWITTRQRGLKPNYGSAPGSVEERSNRFAHLVKDVKDTAPSSAPIQINQDANIYVSEITSGNTVEFVVKENRQAYLLCVEGGVKATSSEGGDPVNLAQHDAMEIRGGPAMLSFTPVTTSASDSAHLLLVEMALDKNSGRKDF
jgi:redox-sensitive bicupin YhaK (pirin superfamily)